MGKVALRWWAKFFRGIGRPCEVEDNNRDCGALDLAIGTRRVEYEDVPAVVPDDARGF
jgi:hypothetical protein